MRLQTCLKIAGALMLSGFLAACGSSGSSTPPPPVATASLESKFGTEFAMIFDASSTSAPTPIDSNSVPPLQPTAQPIAFP